MNISTDQIKSINENPLYHTIGLEVLSAEDGRAVSELRPLADICWPFPGQPHGGILFTQMDTTMAWAVLSKTGEGTNCSTVNMEIQYPAPARGAVFICETRVLHQTGRSCFLHSETRDEAGSLVAMGQATFRIIKAKPII